MGAAAAGRGVHRQHKVIIPREKLRQKGSALVLGIHIHRGIKRLHMAAFRVLRQFQHGTDPDSGAILQGKAVLKAVVSAAPGKRPSAGRRG